MIYIPDGIDGVCYVINNGYVSVYETNNLEHSNNVIYDVYLDNYIVERRTGRGSTSCDTYNTYTHDMTYRTDFGLICICLFILGFVMYYITKLFLIPWAPLISRK